MLSFGKNKDNQTVKNSRYNQVSVADEEIADVLLTEQNEAPLAAALVEPESNKGDDLIYELVVEPKSTATNEEALSENVNLNEQIEKLYREYEAINQQLEKSLVASQELTKQLEASKKVVKTSYMAVAVAGLAVLLAVGGIVVEINLQRDVTDLQNSIAALTGQVAVVKKEAVLKNQEMDKRVAQLNTKVEQIFAADNLENVLQVTRELRKQVSALASKNLAMMNIRNAADQPKEISLPSLKLSAEQLQTPQKLAANQATEKSFATDAVKLAQGDKLASANNGEHSDADGNWTVVFATLKNKKLAATTENKLKKAGIAVEIKEIKAKKHVWYRLEGKTFTNQQEAQTHAEQVRQTLGIKSAALIRTR